MERPGKLITLASTRKNEYGFPMIIQVPRPKPYPRDTHEADRAP